MTEIGEREKTAREIARMRASIRKKHRALKTGKLEDEIALETRLKPIVEPLRRIAGHAERNEDEQNTIKLETADVTPIKRKWKDEDSVARDDVPMQEPIQREKITATKRLRELRRERSSPLLRQEREICPPRNSKSWEICLEGKKKMRYSKPASNLHPRSKRP